MTSDTFTHLDELLHEAGREADGAVGVHAAVVVVAWRETEVFVRSEV